MEVDRPGSAQSQTSLHRILNMVHTSFRTSLSPSIAVRADVRTLRVDHESRFLTPPTTLTFCVDEIHDWRNAVAFAVAV